MSARLGPHPRLNIALGLLLVWFAVLLLPVVQQALGFDTESLSHGPMRISAWLLVLAAAVPGALLLLYRRHIALAELLMTAISGAICLVAVEATLYAAGFHSPRHLGRRHPPLVEWWTYDPVQGNRIAPEKYQNTWPINAEGFGDTDPFDCSGGCDAPRRILFLGDSYTFGSCVSTYQNTYAERLESRFDATAPTTIWNTGIPGIGPPQQEYQLQEFFPRLKPQVVLLALCYNDFQDSLLPVGSLYMFEDGPARYRFALDKDGQVYEMSPLETYKKSVLAPTTLTEYFALPRTGHLVFSAVQKVYAALNPPLPEHAPSFAARGELAAFEEAVVGFAATRARIAEMKAYVEGQGAQFLALIVARPPDLQPVPSLEYVAAQTLFDSLDIDVVEFRDVLNLGDFEGTWHWVDEGHRKVTDVLFPRLEALLPQ